MKSDFLSIKFTALMQPPMARLCLWALLVSANTLMPTCHTEPISKLPVDGGREPGGHVMPRCQWDKLYN